MTDAQLHLAGKVLPSPLPFRMHDFTRLSWGSDSARTVWELRIGRIVQALHEVEWFTVAAGDRRCALRTIHRQEFPEVEEAARAAGLRVEILSGMSAGHSYSASLMALSADEADAFWCVVGRSDDAHSMAKAFERDDQETIGRLLGYPDCCQEFFRRIWVEYGMTDTTWPMAGGDSGKRNLQIEEPSLCSVLLRWIGVRAVFHLPCSFQCEPSQVIAERHINVMQHLGFSDEAEWLRQMLNWPAEWSALHGAAEIRTPVLKITTRTDPTAGTLTVRYLGRKECLPHESVQGLRFPYRTPHLLTISDSQSFQRGLVQQISGRSSRHPMEDAPWYASDNGFISRYAMHKAHVPIVEAARAVLESDRPVAGTPAVVFDFGCGNGALAGKIAALNESLVPGGADFGTAQIEHAKLLAENHRETCFVIKDLFDETLEHDLSGVFIGVLMVGRLTEVSPDAAARFIARICKKVRHLLCYAYDDYIREYGTVEQLANAVGLPLRSGDSQATVRLANLSFVKSTLLVGGTDAG